ncbi:MAG: M23 family metallopeptidase [Bacteroidota bacterium]
MRWLSRLKFKYRLVLLNDETFEERLSFRLSRLNVFISVGSASVLLFFIFTYIIAFTPLREYIPGYASVSAKRDVYQLKRQADSLEEAMKDKDLYILNIKNIIEGKEMIDKIPEKPANNTVYKDIQMKSSKEDSLLRADVEHKDRSSISGSESMDQPSGPKQGLSSFLFFTPVKGMVTNGFVPASHHYGIDIVAKPNEAVKATLDGTVIFSDWTLETGYTIGIQHQQNLISVYKHNATLLKKPGAIVKAGEPVAIVGNSGELSSGPHLHFELWYNGSPVNPKDYMAF